MSTHQYDLGEGIIVAFSAALTEAIADGKISEEAANGIIDRGNQFIEALLTGDALKRDGEHFEIVPRQEALDDIEAHDNPDNLIIGGRE